jgi:opacity protein-like surface antigen
MRIALLLPALLGVTSLASAQAPRSTRPVQLVVAGGVQVPTGGFGDAHDLGMHADASIVFSGLGGLRLRPEISYARFKVKEVIDGLSTQRLSSMGLAGGVRRDVYTDAVSSLLGGFANIELPLGRGGFQPFLLGGIGAVSVKSDATLDQLKSSDVKASVNVGAGVRFRLGGIGGLIEARLNNVPAGDSNESRAFFKDMRSVPVTFGLVF